MTRSTESDCKTLVALCITIIVLFIVWLVVLSLIALYYWRQRIRTRPNRNAINHVVDPSSSEMTAWDSAQGTGTVQTDNAPTIQRYIKSTQTAALLMDHLVTPERPSQGLPPITSK